MASGDRLKHVQKTHSNGTGLYEPFRKQILNNPTTFQIHSYSIILYLPFTIFFHLPFANRHSLPHLLINPDPIPDTTRCFYI